MILVIGYGNPLRSDDGVGQYIARHFDGRLYGEDVQVFIYHQLTPELVSPISQADAVIFVDASQAGQPGEINCLEITAEATRGTFTHYCTPAGLLNGAADLYGAHTRGFIVSVSGYSFEYGETLSPQLEAVVPDVLNSLYQLIEAELARERRGTGQLQPA